VHVIKERGIKDRAFVPAQVDAQPPPKLLVDLNGMACKVDLA
jgi:hypothetical protein